MRLALSCMLLLAAGCGGDSSVCDDAGCTGDASTSADAGFGHGSLPVQSQCDQADNQCQSTLLCCADSCGVPGCTPSGLSHCQEPSPYSTTPMCPPAQ